MSTRIDDGVVQAAGAVVWRPTGGPGSGGAAAAEVLVVHRPRYDDWTFPKGKLERGESHDVGAVREVEEETGFSVQLVDELAHCTYTDHLGRPKYVRYYVAVALGGAFAPNDEVDELRWVPARDAAALLSYERDVEVAATFLAWAAVVPDADPGS